MSSSTNTVTNNAAHLAQLKRQLDTMRSLSNIESCTELEQRMVLADQRKPLLDKIETYELLVENDRVMAAIQKFEDLNPPALEECQLCHEKIRLGDWKKATMNSRGEPCRVLHCCGGIICNKCFDAATKEDTEKETKSCPLCHDVLPSVGSEEMKSQMKKNAQGGHAESQLNLGICLLGPGFLFGGGMYPCDGFETNKKQGLKWIRAAAKQNHPMALYILGKCYLEGIDGILKKSPVDAFRSIELASKLGSSWAHGLLVPMYIHGQGVNKDRAQGVTHMTIAYGLGVRIDTPRQLGGMFKGGLGGLDKNLVLAKHYLEEASMKEVDEKAYGLLGDVLMRLNEEQYDGSIHIPGHSCIPQSLYWLRRAADDGGDETARMKAKGLEEAMQNFCNGCLKTAIGVPRTPGIGQCPGKLQRCSRCKAAWYCDNRCQKFHWKRGHKVDCVDPKKNFSEKFNDVDKLNEAIRASVPPEQYQETRQQFAEALLEAFQKVGPPPRR